MDAALVADNCLYRTTRINPWDGVADCTAASVALPKYLTSFHSKEASFCPCIDKYGSLDVVTTIRRKEANDGTLCGLSLFDYNSTHALRYEMDQNVDCGTELFYPLDQDETDDTIRQKITDIRKRVRQRNQDQTKLTPCCFLCYEFNPQHLLPHDYEVRADETQPGGRRRRGHYTVAPAQDATLSTQLTLIGSTVYGYCENILNDTLWKPHCIRFRVLRSLDPFQLGFDDLVWRVCRLIYHDGLQHENYEVASVLSDVYCCLQENKYHLDVDALLRKQTLDSVVHAFKCLQASMQSLEDSSDITELAERCTIPPSL